jgi:hypothetical protein
VSKKKAVTTRKRGDNSIVIAVNRRDVDQGRRYLKTRRGKRIATMSKNQGKSGGGKLVQSRIEQAPVDLGAILPNQL